MLVLLNVFGEEWKDLPLLQVMKPGLILKLLKLFMCSKLLFFFSLFVTVYIKNFENALLCKVQTVILIIQPHTVG